MIDTGILRRMLFADIKKREPSVAVPPLEAFALPESVERTTHKAHADMNIAIPLSWNISHKLIII